MRPPMSVWASVVALLGCIIGTMTTLPWWVFLVMLAGAGPWVILRSDGPALLLVLGLWMTAHAAQRAHMRPDGHLAHHLGLAQSRPVEVEGRVLDVDALGCTVEVHAVRTRHAVSRCSGRARVVLPTWVHPPQAGAAVRVLGRGRVQRSGAIMIEVHDGRHVRVVTPIEGLRAWARRVVTAPPIPPDRLRDLVDAVTLGYRGRDYRVLAEPFRSTGTSHMLAVSGLHLAVLCGVVLVPARLLGVTPRWRAPLIGVVAILMTVVALPRIPLLRAASMAVVISVAGLWARRIPAGSVLATVLVGVLLIDPSAVFAIGFQLSFTVVAGLIWVLPAWGRRCRIAGITESTTRTLWRATVVAWLLSMPLALHHFGVCALLGVPATVLLMPILAAVLSAAFVRLTLGWIPGVELAAGMAVWVSVDVLAMTVDLLAWIPGVFWRFGRPGWFWVVAMEAAVITLLISTNRRALWAASVGGVVLAGAVWFMDA